MPVLHPTDMTEFKSCVSFSQDGRARENLLALYAIRKKKPERVQSTRVRACELRGLARVSFISISSISLGMIGHSELKPI